MKLVRLLSSALFTISVSGAAAADSNLMFILDGSNSMWGQIDGVAKISAAQTVLGETIANLPETVEPSLVVFGHRSKASCEDIQLVSPFGSGRTADIGEALSNISPRGKTPLAASLKMASETFAGQEKDKNSILLISDGSENCAGDPCAVAGELASGETRIRVFVIGFNVNDRARTQLQCIAEKGRGGYYDAADAEAFKAAVAEAQILARGPESIPTPKPAPEPVVSDIFDDEFDGKALGPMWQVVRPNPEKFVVYDGNLLLVEGGSDAQIDAEGRNNVIKLAGVDLPEGDWIVTVFADFRIQTAREIFSVVLDDGSDSRVTTSLVASGDRFYGWALNLNMTLESDGSSTGSTSLMAELTCEVCTSDQRIHDFAASLNMPVELKLIKEGWTYHAKARLSGGDDSWVSTERVTAQEIGGNLAISLGQYEPVEGESFAKVDRVKIEAVN